VHCILVPLIRLAGRTDPPVSPLITLTGVSIEIWTGQAVDEWGTVAKGINNGKSYIRFSKVQFFRPEAVAAEYSSTDGDTGLVQAVVFDVNSHPPFPFSLVCPRPSALTCVAYSLHDDDAHGIVLVFQLVLVRSLQRPQSSIHGPIWRTRFSCGAVGHSLNTVEQGKGVFTATGVQWHRDCTLTASARGTAFVSAAYHDSSSTRRLKRKAAPGRDGAAGRCTIGIASGTRRRTA
jgi:hypothetical protein